MAPLQPNGVSVPPSPSHHLSATTRLGQGPKRVLRPQRLEDTEEDSNRSGSNRSGDTEEDSDRSNRSGARGTGKNNKENGKTSDIDTHTAHETPVPEEEEEEDTVGVVVCSCFPESLYGS
jgi:hypothetical protein